MWQPKMKGQHRRAVKPNGFEHGVQIREKRRLGGDQSKVVRDWEMFDCGDGLLLKLYAWSRDVLKDEKISIDRTRSQTFSRS